jgi:hypothetical protein
MSSKADERKLWKVLSLRMIVVVISIQYNAANVKRTELMLCEKALSHA